MADYKGGKEKAMGFLVGQTMKAMKGKADPGTVNKILKPVLELNKIGNSIVFSGKFVYYERKAEKKEDIQRRRGLKLKKYKIAAAMLGICMAVICGGCSRETLNAQLAESLGTTGMYAMGGLWNRPR